MYELQPIRVISQKKIGFFLIRDILTKLLHILMQEAANQFCIFFLVMQFSSKKLKTHISAINMDMVKVYIHFVISKANRPFSNFSSISLVSNSK